jgi:hypothetical protein
VGYIGRPTTMRAAGLTLMALTTGLASGWASVIQSSVVLPPASGAYTLEGICVAALDKCAGTFWCQVSVPITDTEQNGNEVVTVNATYLAGVYTDNGGVPGSFIGQLSLSGTAEFTYMGARSQCEPVRKLRDRVDRF